MIALDTSFLVDYLDGREPTREFLDDHEGKPFFAPTLALFEVYRGAARSGGTDRLGQVVTALDWLDPLPLTEAAAREAALVEAELHDAGTPVNLGDVLVAGVCRSVGASVVTRDGHFDRVQDLAVLRY